MKNIKTLFMMTYALAFFITQDALAFDHKEFADFCKTINYKYVTHQVVKPLPEKYPSVQPVRIDEYKIKSFREIHKDTYSRYTIHVAHFANTEAASKQEICYLPPNTHSLLGKSMYALCEGFKKDAQIFEVMTDGGIFTGAEQERVLNKLKLWLLKK